ncbi:hypothetical protein HAX54_002968, partial [Datura stramonium]|nr:hypothetical protein [Datura stramonium]
TTPRWLATDEEKYEPSFRKTACHSEDRAKSNKHLEPMDEGKDGPSIKERIKAG